MSFSDFKCTNRRRHGVSKSPSDRLDGCMPARRWVPIYANRWWMASARHMPSYACISLLHIVSRCAAYINHTYMNPGPMWGWYYRGGKRTERGGREREREIGCERVALYWYFIKISVHVCTSTSKWFPKQYYNLQVELFII